MDSFGDRLRRLREADKKTQQDIADALANYGIKTNRAAVAKWESNVNTPVLHTAMSLAHILGVTTDYLIEGLGSDVMPKPNEKEIIKAVRLNPKLACLIECAKAMTADQIDLACRLICTIKPKEKAI